MKATEKRNAFAKAWSELYSFDQAIEENPFIGKEDKAHFRELLKQTRLALEAAEYND